MGPLGARCRGGGRRCCFASWKSRATSPAAGSWARGDWDCLVDPPSWSWQSCDDRESRPPQPGWAVESPSLPPMPPGNPGVPPPLRPSHLARAGTESGIGSGYWRRNWHGPGTRSTPRRCRCCGNWDYPPAMRSTGRQGCLCSRPSPPGRTPGRTAEYRLALCSKDHYHWRLYACYVAH